MNGSSPEPTPNTHPDQGDKLLKLPLGTRGNLSVRTKIFILIGITVIGLAVLLYALTQTILLQSFADLERDRMQENTNRVLAALDNELAQLKATAADWAQWDDTYNYMEGRNPAYVQSNLTPTTYVNLNINLFMLLDSERAPVLGHIYVEKDQEIFQITPELISQYMAFAPLRDYITLREADTASGLLITPVAPMLIVIEPVLTSRLEGPERGLVIMGRYLREEEMARIRASTHLQIDIWYVNDSDLPADAHAAYEQLQDEPIAYSRQGDTYSGYSLLEDVRGEPALIIRIQTPRDTYQQGHEAIRYFIVLFVGLGALLAATITLLINHQVLARVLRLNQEVRRIEQGASAQNRVSVNGHDELTVLGLSINAMLDAAQHSQEALAENERIASEFKDRLRALHEVHIALSPETDSDQLLRQAVELGRDRLGFDRLGIWLLDENDPSVALPTFGTNPQGEIIDERTRREPLARDPRLEEALQLKLRANAWEDVPIRGVQQEVIGHGWTALAALWNGTQTIGWLFSDNLIMQRPLLAYHVELLSLYGSAIGSLYTRLHTQAALRQTRDELAQRVNERQQAEDQLRISQERLEMALQAAELGLWDWQIANNQTIYNERWANMLGYSLEEIKQIPKTWERLLHPDDRERAMLVLSAHLAGKTTIYEIEHRLRTKSGEWKWVLARGKVVERDAHQLAVRIIGTHQDITSRKQAEAEREYLLGQMRTRANELASVAQISRQITTILDLDRLLWVVCDLMKSEFDFYHVHIYLLNEQSQELKLAAGHGEIAQALVKEGLFIALNSPISAVAKAGRSREVINLADVSQATEFLPNPLLPKTRSELAIPMIVGDRLLGVLNIEDDKLGRFTESDVNLQTALTAQISIAVDNARLFSENARRFAIIENVKDLVALTDLTAPELKPIYINPAGLKLTGYSGIEEALNLPVREFYPPEFRDSLKNEVLPAVLDQGVWRGESTLLRQDGTVIPVEQTIFVIRDEHGTPRDLAAIVTDLTERQRAEYNLRRINRAYRALSDCNQAMVRAADETELLRDICRIVVEAGGYRMAWVVLGEYIPDAPFNVSAYAGHEAGYLSSVLTGNLPEHGPTRMAYETGLPCVVWNIATDPLFAPWREEALARGYRSMVALPLKSDDKIIGNLNVYAAEPHAFDMSEVTLLNELAGDLAYGVAALNLRREREAAEAEMRRAFEGEHIQRVLAEALSDTATTITRTLNSRVVIESILDRLQYVIEHSAANLMLIEGDFVQVVGCRGYDVRGLDEWVRKLRVPFLDVSGMRYMYETGQPLVFADIDRDFPNWALVPEVRWVKSYAGAPIQLEGRVIGFLNIYSDQPAFFANVDPNRLQSFATLAAIAIRNAQLFDAERGQRALAEALITIAAALNQQLDPDMVMDRILTNLQQVVPYDAASMMLIKDHIAYVVRHNGFEERGMADAVENLRLPLSHILQFKSVPGAVRPFRVDDVQQFAHWDPLPGGEWMHSYLCAPIQYGDQLLGLLNLDSATTGFFTDEHGVRLQAFADQAAIAIQNAQLFAAEREQRIFNETLRDIAAAINQTLDLETVLSEILLHIRRVVPHDAANIMLIEDGVARIVRESGYSERGLGEWARQINLSVKENGTLRRIIESGQPLIISDTDHDPGWQWFSETDWIKAMVTVPLRQENQVIGFMNVYSVTRNYYGMAHLDRLQAFAEQVSHAIRNARLFTGIQQHATEIQRRADQLALINRVAVRLAQTLDPREIYDIAATELQTALHMQAVSLVLFESDEIGYIVFDSHPMAPLDGRKIQIGRDSSRAMAQFFESRQTIIVEDVDQDTLFTRMKTIWKMRGTRSAIMIPMLAGDDLIGFIGVDSKEPRVFSAAEREICETITSQVSVAIAKAQLYYAEREQRMLAQTLSQTAAAINQTLNASEVLNLILQNIGRVVEHDAANIMLLEDGTARVVVEKGYDEQGVGDWVRAHRFNVAEVPIWRRMFESGRPFAISDTAQDPDWLNLVGQEESWIRSTIKAPIRVEGRIIGILHVDSAKPGMFSEKDADRLQALADQAAVALRNAQFFAEIQRSAERLSQQVIERTAELEQQRAQLQTILDSISEGVMYDEKLQINFINRALTRLTGYVQPDLTGYLNTLLSSKYDDGQRALITRRIFDSVDRMSIWQGELRLRRKDGSEFEASLTATPVREPGGAAVGAVTVIRDISQEKALRDQKDRFIASASHELRTPLTNFKTRLYLLKRQPEKFDQHLNVLNHVTNNMAELVENLLDVSRFERGVIVLHPRKMALQDLINDVVAVQTAEAERKNVTLVTDLPASPLHCLVDPPRIIQVITNLVTNAINYTPSGGQIRVELRTDNPEMPEQAVLNISDTGIGIPPHMVDRVFDPFFRGREEIAVGTGLGLTIAKEIVNLHGGQIEVQSELDRGSVFTVRLNLVRS